MSPFLSHFHSQLLNIVLFISDITIEIDIDIDIDIEIAMDICHDRYNDIEPDRTEPSWHRRLTHSMMPPSDSMISHMTPIQYLRPCSFLEHNRSWSNGIFCILYSIY
eukprot:292968_1